MSEWTRLRKRLQTKGGAAAQLDSGPGRSWWSGCSFRGPPEGGRETCGSAAGALCRQCVPRLLTRASLACKKLTRRHSGPERDGQACSKLPHFHPGLLPAPVTGEKATDPCLGWSLALALGGAILVFGPVDRPLHACLLLTAHSHLGDPSRGRRGAPGTASATATGTMEVSTKDFARQKFKSARGGGGRGRGRGRVGHQGGPAHGGGDQDGDHGGGHHVGSNDYRWALGAVAVAAAPVGASDEGVRLAPQHWTGVPGQGVTQIGGDGLRGCVPWVRARVHVAKALLRRRTLAAAPVQPGQCSCICNTCTRTTCPSTPPQQRWPHRTPHPRHARTCHPSPPPLPGPGPGPRYNDDGSDGAGATGEDDDRLAPRSQGEDLAALLEDVDVQWGQAYHRHRMLQQELAASTEELTAEVLPAAAAAAAAASTSQQQPEVGRGSWGGAVWCGVCQGRCSVGGGLCSKGSNSTFVAARDGCCRPACSDRKTSASGRELPFV